MKNHWYKTASAGVLLLALVFLAGCSALEPEPLPAWQENEVPLIEQVGLERTEDVAEVEVEAEPEVTVSVEAAPVAEVEEASASKEVVIEMDSFTEIIDGKFFPQFSEKEIRVKKGDKVKLLINTTKGVHDFRLDEFDVHVETPVGEVTTVEFVADKAGTFEYYCHKPRHRELGHKGTLIVE